MVSALKQLGLVLKKNIILRIREPLVFLFEILWPVLIFLVVVLVRMNIDPESKSECVYAPRANPTAGFQFLQDYACNIDNKCYGSEEEATQSRQKSGAASLLKAVEPLYSESVKTQQFLEELPNTVKVLESLSDIVENEGVQELLDPEKQPRIRDLVDDPDEVQRYFVGKNILTDYEAETILNTTVNITQLLQMQDSIDFPAILCDPDQLFLYFHFPDDLDVVGISQRLCENQDVPVTDISDYLISQISLPKIFGILRDFMNNLSSPDQAEVFGAIADLLDLVKDLDSIKQLGETWAWLGESAGWMLPLLNFVEKLTSEFSMEDLALLGEVLESIEPLFDTLNIPAIDTLKNIIGYFDAAQDVLSGVVGGGFDMKNLSLGSLLPNQTGLLNVLTSSFNISGDLALQLLSLNFDAEKLTQYITQVASDGDVSYALCVDPGLANILTPDNNITADQLQAIQEAVCSDGNMLAAELLEALGLESFVQKVQEMESGASPDIDWSQLLENSGQLVGALTASVDSIEPLLEMFRRGFSVEDLYLSLASAAGGLMDTDSLLDLVPLTTQIGDMVNNQQFDLFGYVGFVLVDIFDKLADKIPASAYVLADLMSENADLRDVIEGVLAMDPEQAPVILARLFDPIRLQTLLASNQDLDTLLCDPDGLAEFLELDTMTNVTVISGILCGRDINEALQTLADTFDLTEINEQFNILLLVLEGKVMPNVTVDYAVMTEKIQSLQLKISDQVIAMVYWDALQDVWAGLQVNEQVENHWIEFVNQFSLQYTLSIGGSLLENLGGQLEQRDAWFVLAPWLKVFTQSLHAAEVIFNSLYTLQDETSVPGRITRMAVLYLPEILYEVAETLNSSNGQMFLTELSSDPIGLFCDYDKLASYLQPTDKLPLQDIVMALCTLDVGAFQAPFVDVYVETLYSIEIIIGHINLRTSDVYEQNIDWAGLYQRGQALSGRLNDFIMDQSMWQLWSGFDYTRANEALMLLLEGAMNIQTTQLAGIVAQQDQALQDLLASMGDTEMFTYYMVGVQWYLDVLNKYLQSGGDGLRLDELLGNSTWLEGRLNEALGISPDLAESLSTAVLKPEQLMMILLTSNLTGQELCSDLSLTDFLTLTDPDKVEDLERLLCDVEVESFLAALMGSGMLQDINEVTMFLQNYDPSKLPSNMSFSFTELMATVTQTMTLLTSAMNSTEPLESLLFPGLLNLDVDSFNALGEGLIGSLLNLTMDDVAQWSAMASQMLGMITGQMTPELNLIFSFMDAIYDLSLRSLIFVDQEKLLEMFPVLGEYLSLMDILPEVMSAAALTVSQTDSSGYASLIVSNPALLCNVTDLADIIVLPPDSTIDLTAFQSQLCSLNLTQVTMESTALANYVAGPLITVLATPTEFLPEVNLTAMFIKQNLLQEQITVLATQDWEQTLNSYMMGMQWLNGDLWEQQTQHVINNIMPSTNPSDYASAFNGLEGLSALLNLPELNQQLNLILAILEQVNEKLGRLEGNSSLADMFPSSPELAKLATMMEEFPYVFELFVRVGNNPTPGFSALLSNPNATEVLVTICHPLTDIQDYFPAPAGWQGSEVSVEALRDRFCQVDFVALQSEINTEFDMEYIMQQSVNPNPINWTLFYIHVDAAINHLTRVVTSPPTEFGTPIWQNASFWLSTILAGDMTEQDIASIDNYQWVIQLLYTVLGDESGILTDLAAAMNEIAKSINEQIALLTKPDLTLFDVFSDSPEVLALLNASLGYSNEALGSILSVPFSNPMMLLQLQAMSSEELCSQPLSYYKEIFAITEDQVAENVRTFVCNLNSSVWEVMQEELASKVGLAEILALAGFTNSTSNMATSGINSTLAAQLNWAQLSETLTELGINVESLMSQFNMDSLLPEFSQAELENLIASLYTNISAENIDTLLPAFMAGLAPLYGTEAGEMLEDYMKAIDAIVQYLNDMLMKLRPNGDGTVDIQTLFGGAEQWNQLLQTVFSETPDLLPSLQSITVKTEKIADLIMLDASSVDALLCSEEMMREYFVFPDTVDVSKIVQGTCGLNATLLMLEFENTFQVMGLIDRITNPTAEDLAIEDIVARFTQFIMDVSALTNIKDLLFFNQTIGQFLSLDISSFDNADELLNTLSSAGGFNIEDFYANFTTIEDVLDFVYESLKITAASLGPMYQDDSTNSLLRLMDIVMKTLAERLEQSTPGELTLGSLVGNIDELETVLEATFDLEPDVLAALLTSPIPTYAVLELVMAANTGVLDSTYCHPNITAELPDSINDSADELINLLCSLDYDALWPTIQEYINYDELESLFMQAIDPSSMTYSIFNWTEYAENFDSWKGVIDRLMGVTNPSDELTQLFSTERLWAFVEYIMQIQATATLESFGFDFLKDLPTHNWYEINMIEIATEAVLHQLEMFRDSGATLGDLFTDNSLLTEWYTRLSLLTTRLSSSLAAQTEAEIFFDTIGQLQNRTELMAVVCDVNTLEMVLKQTAAEYDLSYKPYWDLQKVSDILCAQDPSDWWDSLTEAGFEWNDIYDIAYLLQLQSSTSLNPEPKGWDQIVENLSEISRVLTDLDDLTQTLSNVTEADLMAFLEALNQAQLASSLSLTTENLRALSGLRLGPPGLLSAMVYTMGYLNGRLEQLLGNGSTVALSELIPNEAEVRARLSTMLSEASIDDLLKISMDPTLFMQFDNAESWQKLVCNTTAFEERVDTESLTDPNHLQAELCNASFNGDNVMEILLDLIEFNTFLQKVMEIAQQEAMEDPFKAFQAQMEVLLGNIGRIQGIEDYEDMDAWLEILSGIGNADLPQTDATDYTDVCTAGVSTLTQHFGSTSVATLALNQEYMELFVSLSEMLPAVSSLTCDLQLLSLQELYHLFNSSGIMKFIGQFSELLERTMFPTEEFRFDCASYLETVARYTEVVDQNYMALGQQLGMAFECLANSAEKTIPALAQVDSYFGLLTDLDYLLENIPELQDVIKQVDGTALAILQQIIQREDVMVRLSDIFLGELNMTELLYQLSTLTQEEIDALLNSTISGLDLMELWKMTTADLEAILCIPGRLNEVLEFAGDLPDLSMISEELCKANLTQLLDIARMGMNMGELLNQISEGTSGYYLNTDWLKLILREIEGILGSTNNLLELMESLAILDLTSLPDVLPELLAFLQEDVELIADSLEEITEILEMNVGTLNPTIAVLIQDLKTILAGVRALGIFSDLSVSLEDILTDPDDVKDYMMTELGLSEELTMTILEARLTNYALMDITGALDVDRYACNATLLGMIFEFEDTTAEEVTEELCQVEMSNLERWAEKLRQHFNTATYVMEVLSIDPEEILGNVGVNKTEFSNVVEAFLPLQQSLDAFATNLNLSTEIMTAAEALQQGQTDMFTSLSQILCGRDDAFDIEDEFQLGGTEEDPDETPSRRKKRQTEEEIVWQNYERSRFSTAYCKNMYDELMSSDGGRVIWSFLKPLLIGQIPYYPHNVITEAIMREAISIFDLQDIRTFSESFIEATDAIKDLIDRGDEFQNLEDALSEPLVNFLVTQALGVDPSIFTDQLSALSSIDPAQLDAMADVADLLIEASHCVLRSRLEPMQSEDRLEDQSKDLAVLNELLAAVVFLDMDDISGMYTSSFEICNQIGNSQVPKHIRFKIRMEADDVPQTKSVRAGFWMPDADNSFAEDLRYFRGFIQMQDLIEDAILKLMTGCDGEKPVVESQQFPTPCHEDDIFQRFVGLYIFPILMVLAQLVVVGVSIRNVVYDKENGLEETMKAMGLRPGVNWMGWFLNTYIMMLITDLIITLLMHFGNLFPYTDFGLLFVYLAVFSFSVLMMCYLISVFFFRTTLAALVGLIVYLISYVPYIVLANLVLYGMEFWQIFLACLSSTTAFSFGAQMIAQMELRSVGMQWSDIQGTVVYENFSFAWVYYMMLIDSGIYLLLGWYLRNVLPGKYGVRQPLYFFLLPSYWGCNCGRSSSKYKPHRTQANSDSSQGLYKKTGEENSTESSVHDPSGSKVSSSEHGYDHSTNRPEQIAHQDEEAQTKLPVGVSLHNLSKKFGSKKSLVNLNVNFHQEHITAFLGQNGAGKTTTVNLLTGIYEPSSGDAFVSNKSILTHMGSIRTDLGVCPQHDVLFSYLTVREHLDFFANLKANQSLKDKNNDIERMIELTGLENHANVKVKELSGGQKRRLSVALAFIGGSKVIVLDEPTSGIDPCARRNIWDLITQNRAGRTIILSTHHMDEADILADRIVLLHKGCILTTGSPLYLKSQYGSGYNLTVSKDVASNAPHHAHARGDADASAIVQFLSQYVPDTVLVEEVGTEMTFMLPTHQGQLARFQEMFAHLEKQKYELGVSSYGVSDTTLEEVFLKLTMSADNHQSLEPDKLRQWHLNRNRMETGTSKTGSSSGTHVDGTDPDKRIREIPFVVKYPNFFTRILALFYKRFLHHARDFRNYLSQIILPVLFICLAMGMSIIVPNNNNEPSLLLVPDLYEDTTTFYRLENNAPLFKDFENKMLKSPWLGTACMTGDKEFSDLCDGTPGEFETDSVPANKYGEYANPGECTCEEDRHNCPEGAGGLPPPHKRLGSGLDMYNLTDNQFTLQDYLLRTYTENIENRYGGFSFMTGEDSLQAKVWYNNKGYHALPAYQNAYTNTLLRSRLGEAENAEDYGISVYNHPLKLDKEVLSEMTLLQSVAQTGLALVILCAFCFIPAGCTIFVVSERVNQERQLQMIYGVGMVMYWIVALIWDMLTYLISVALAVGIAAAFDIDIYTDRDNLGAFAVCLIMFGWACLPLMYLLSRIFKDVSISYIVIFLVNFLIGLVTVCCTFLLSLFDYMPKIDEAHEILSHVFKIFPQFCLGDALVLLSRNQFISNIYDQFKVNKYKDPYSYDMVAWHLVAMAIQGAVFFSLNLMLDIRCRRTRNGPISQGNKSPYRLNHRNKDRNYKEDDDVSLERQRVTTGDARSDLLVLHDLKKMYRRGFKKVKAVNDLSIGIPRGECFGLLGVNGAGKTTTFNMITSTISPSKGVAMLNGRVISEDPGNMKGQVGYCPQVDALDKFLTGRQLLYFYSLVKGIQNSEQVINFLVKELGLESHQNRLIKTYSGGTKRKLSTAIALLGNPDLILMDEPTTGMDAGSRRMVWTCIQDAVSRGTSVVLTSHSMMECDALCTRMAVMVNGRFRCLGNGQHLKSKFGTGYTVKTRVSGVPPDLQKVTDFMLANFTGCYLKDFHLNQLEFEIPSSSVRLSEVFGRLEAEKSMLHIQEYSVSQPTLEQVFISFAKHQHDGEENEVEGPTHAYANLGYGTISSLGRGAEVRKSLKSIPGYDPGLVKPEDVSVDVNDRPSSSGTSSDRRTSSAESAPSSTGSDTVSPASTLPMRDPGEEEVSIVDPVTGEVQGVIHQEGNTTVVQL